MIHFQSGLKRPLAGTAIRWCNTMVSANEAPNAYFTLQNGRRHNFSLAAAFSAKIRRFPQKSPNRRYFQRQNDALRTKIKRQDKLPCRFSGYPDNQTGLSKCAIPNGWWEVLQFGSRLLIATGSNIRRLFGRSRRSIPIQITGRGCSTRRQFIVIGNPLSGLADKTAIAQGRFNSALVTSGLATRRYVSSTVRGLPSSWITRIAERTAQPISNRLIGEWPIGAPNRHDRHNRTSCNTN